MQNYYPIRLVDLRALKRVVPQSSPFCVFGSTALLAEQKTRQMAERNEVRHDDARLPYRSASGGSPAAAFTMSSPGVP